MFPTDFLSTMRDGYGSDETPENPETHQSGKSGCILHSRSSRAPYKGAGNRKENGNFSPRLLNSHRNRIGVFWRIFLTNAYMANRARAPDKEKRSATVEVRAASKSDEADAVARTMTHPAVQAASVIRAFGGDSHDVNALVKELVAQVGAVKGGDLSRSEAMLSAQAHALDEIFASLARRAHANMGAGYLDASDRYMRLALKAQSQCRATLETLTEMKNPRPVAFVAQANVANGPMQVNNGGATLPDASRAGNSENRPNELSGKSHEPLSDGRTSQAEARIETPIGTLGKLQIPVVSGGT